jgi:mono/diheme cytochrome c family protein
MTGKTPLAAALLAALSAPALAAPPQQPADADPVLGETLYQENCASCHGEKLEGEPDWRTAKEDGTLPAPPHDETGHTWHHGDGLLFNYTKLGGQEALAQRGVTGFTSGMPGFAEVLTDDEIWHILAYIKSTWDPQVQEVQAAQTEAEQAQAR